MLPRLLTPYISLPLMNSRKKIIIAIALMFACSLALSSAGFLAQASGDVQGDFIVWVPSKMMAGEKYQGLVVMTNTTSFARDVLLVSTNPDVVLPQRITIMPGVHQAAFDINVLPSAASSIQLVRVSAVQGSSLTETSATVFAGGSDNLNVIRLLAFNNTNLNYARVVALTQTSNGVFAPPSSNLTVSLAYTGGVAHTVIDSKTGYGVVDVPLIDGANKISVTGRPGDSIVVTRSAIAPVDSVKVSALSTIPAWSPEWGYIGSWVLVDASRDGKPLRGNFEVIITSSNPGVVEVVSSDRLMCSLPCAITVEGHDEGSAQIGVQVAGVGGGSVTVATVQPTRYVPRVTVDVKSIIAKDIQKKHGSVPFILNGTAISFSSEKTISSVVSDGPVYGLAGHYATLTANYTVLTSPSSIESYSKLVPILVPGVVYHLLSAGGAAGAFSSNDFDGLMKGNISKGGSPSAMKSASVGVGSSYASMQSFDVAINESTQDLKGDATAISLPGSGLQLSAYLVGNYVRGYPKLAESVTANTQTLSVDGSQIGGSVPTSSMEVDVPALVYPSEGFVFSAHITQAGVPVQRVYPLYELGAVDSKDAGNIQQIDTVFIQSRYVAKVSMSVVMNAIDLTVPWPEILKSSRSYNMTMNVNVADAKIQVSGDIPAKVAGETVTLFPSGEGDKKVVIAASKAGWTTTSAEKTISVKKYVNTTIIAKDEKGLSIVAPFSLEYETVDGKVGRVEGVTPYVLDERPFASKTITFNAAATPGANNGNSTYTLKNARETDTGFTGIYERQMKLTVVGGLGSGDYFRGQNVHIEADPYKQVLGFAVVNKFSHWEYDNDANSLYVRDANSRSQNIVVNDDATLTAVYATDFTLLAVLVLSTAGAVASYAFREEIKTIVGAYRKS
jgi:hypothetical protein